MDYTPSHKYLFPRLYRERMYGGVEKRMEFNAAGSYIADRMCTTHENYELKSTCDNFANVNIVDTIAGRTVRHNSADSQTAQLAEFRDVNTIILTAGDPAGYTNNFTYMVKHSFVNDVAKSSYLTGDQGEDGYNLGRGGGDYFVHYQYAAAGDQAILSPNNQDIAGNWYNWVAVSEPDTNTGTLYRDMVLKPRAGWDGAQVADPSTTGGPRICVATEAQIDVARIVLYNKALSHEEAAMLSADLM